MGIGIGHPSFDSSSDIQPPPANPNPANFRIVRTKAIGRFLIVEIHYPDCTNFEGRKVLVYEGVTDSQIQGQKRIDPHFHKNDGISPIARFAPTQQGWEYAEKLCLSA